MISQALLIFSIYKSDSYSPYPVDSEILIWRICLELRRFPKSILLYEREFPISLTALTNSIGFTTIFSNSGNFFLYPSLTYL